MPRQAREVKDQTATGLSQVLCQVCQNDMAGDPKVQGWRRYHCGGEVTFDVGLEGQ